MRALSLTLAAASALVSGAAAAQAPTSPPSVAAAAAAPLDPAAEIERLREQNLAGSQELTRLRRALADQTARAAALDACRAKNARLVAIGNELVAAYGKRYRASRHDPFQLGRRRFEAELQNTSDAIYAAQADVTEKTVKPSQNEATTGAGSHQ